MGSKYFGALVVLLFTNLALSGQIIIAQGQVSTKVKDKEIPLKSGSQIQHGQTITTGADSFAVVKLENGATLKLNEFTTLEISDKAQADLELYRGSVFTKFKKTKDGRLRIRTRSAVSGVRGTEFFISYGGRKSQDDMWLCVNEGVVDVRTLKSPETIAVKAGQGVSVKRGTGISDPRPLPWTKKLNWNMDPKKGDLKNTVSIEEAYTDLLDQDYD